MATKRSYAPVETVDENTGSPTSNKTLTKPSCLNLKSVDDNWLVEILCTVLGTVLVIALYLVLQVYDGHPAPQFGSAFGSSLTLNTIVAIIATIAKTLLLLPVAECVGQLKWIWFSQDYRQLAEFGTFDKASRGNIWGGFELLWTTKLGSFASFGAFLTIFAVAIDPLSQQLIAYRTDSVADRHANASIDIAVVYSEFLSTNNAFTKTGQDARDLMDLGASPQDYGFISTGMRGAIQTGLYSSNEQLLDISALCPGGHCSFSEYSSLAVCTSFADVSEHLYHMNVSTPNGTWPYDLQIHISPSHYLSNNNFGYLNVSSVATGFQDNSRQGHNFLNFSNSIAFPDVLAPLADVFLLVANGTEPDPDPEFAPHYTYMALEFILEWCVQNFTTIVTNGTSSTKRLSAERNITTKNSGDIHFDLPGGDKVEGFSVGASYHASLQWLFRQLLLGTSTQDGAGGFYVSSDAAQALFEPFNFFQPHATDEEHVISNGLLMTNRTGLEFIVDNIATSMTNYIRRHNDYASSSDPDSRVTSAQGTILHQVTVVRIRWPWIAAHAAFTTFSIVFLAATILCQRTSPLRGQQPWKSSGLAILHALEPDLQKEMQGIKSVSKLQEQEKGQGVKLLSSGNEGWRLLGRGKSEENY